MIFFDDLKVYYIIVFDCWIQDLFDISWVEDFLVCLGDVLFDYFKINIDVIGWLFLIDLLDKIGFVDKCEVMFIGGKINEIEGCVVLYIVLCNLDGDLVEVDGQDVIFEVCIMLDCMVQFVIVVWDGLFQGQGGKIIDVVNIGIGGFDFGFVMVYLVFVLYIDGLCCYFVLNVDLVDIVQVLCGCDLVMILVIVVFKIFIIIEIMINVCIVKVWMGEIVFDFVV